MREKHHLAACRFAPRRDLLSFYGYDNTHLRADNPLSGTFGNGGAIVRGGQSMKRLTGVLEATRFEIGVGDLGRSTKCDI